MAKPVARRPATPPGPAHRRGTAMALLAAIVVLTVIVFAPLASFEFVEWDDPENLVRNAYLALPWSEAVGHFWGHFHFGSYIPVTRSLWASLWRISSDPGLFHLANLAVHLANVLLLYGLLGRLGFGMWGAGAGALLFAIHPLPVEPVAWVTGMKALLSMAWMLAGLLLSIEVLRPRPGARPAAPFGWATACFALAMLSKATAVLAPLLVVVIGLGLGASWRRMLPLVALWVALAVPIVIATRLAEAQVSVVTEVPLGSRPLIMADAYGFYLRKLVAPFALSPDYGRTPGRMMGDPMRYGHALAAVVVAALAVWAGRRRRWPAVAAAVFAVALLPVSGVVPFVYQNTSTVADRYMYFAMIGPSMALAWALDTWRGRVPRAVAAAVLLALAVLSARQAPIWRNTTTLFEQVLSVNPRSAIAHNNLGIVVGRQGRLDEAIHRFRAALALEPTLSDAHNNLGFTLYMKGHPDSAITECRAAVRAFGRNAQARKNLGLLLSAYGDPEEAKLHLREAIRLAPFDTTSRGALQRLDARGR